jgi:UrcA family protein
MAGALGAAMLFGIGAAAAQDFANGPTSDERLTVRSHNALHSRPAPMTGDPNAVEMWISRDVSYSDLDLTKAADMRELQARISVTARNICRQLQAQDPFADRPLSMQPAGRPTPAQLSRQCVSTAVNNAMRDVNSRTSAALTDLYRR